MRLFHRAGLTLFEVAISMLLLAISMLVVLAAIPVGDTAIARAKPFHRGKTTMVWQTEISRQSDGRLAAVVTQTQLVLLPRG